MGDTELQYKPSALSFDSFMEVYGGIYEHSSWIAETAFKNQNIDIAEALHAAMVQAVTNGTEEQKLALIKAHPDLGVAAVDIDKLTASSTAEQVGAGLKECTPEEFKEFQKLNAAYKNKFGFPFIVAVKGLTRHDILKMFRERIQNEIDEEFQMALKQIHKIAYFRLMELSV